MNGMHGVSSSTRFLQFKTHGIAGFDEYHPVSKDGRQMVPKGMGWIIVDALDILKSPWFISPHSPGFEVQPPERVAGWSRQVNCSIVGSSQYFFQPFSRNYHPMKLAASPAS